jgi:hypothetical protein
MHHNNFILLVACAILEDDSWSRSNWILKNMKIVCINVFVIFLLIEGSLLNNSGCQS